jgi:uncharacterized lipoprotein YajG
LRTAAQISVPRGPRWIRTLETHHQRFLLALLLIASSLCPAQNSPQALQSVEQESSIKGTVVNAVTGVPIARALVQAGDSYAMLTDGEGHFEFNLPKAGSSNEAGVIQDQRYTFSPSSLTARKPGFLNDPTGPRQAEIGPTGEITIPLLPEALIKGRVISSETDPATGITVQLFLQQVQEGILRWVQAGSGRANSNGEFRFAELLPGTYRLATNEWMDNDPATTVPGGQLYGYPPVFYPGNSDFAAAGTIQLTAGQTVQADIPLTRQPYYPVRIPVTNAEVNGGMNVTVSVQGHRGPGYSLGYNAGNQRIEGLLPHGNYLVEASILGQSSSSGAVQLSVAGAPAEGPGLTVIPNSSINVHVTDEFTTTDWRAEGISNNGKRSFPTPKLRLDLNIRAEPADDFAPPTGGNLRAPAGPNDNSMVLENLTPGRYWLRAYAARGYVSSASMGGVDLLHEPFIVAPGSSTPIEITLRDDNAEIAGTIAGVTPTAPAAGPSANAGWLEQSAYIYCVPVSNSAGQFLQLSASSDGKFDYQMVAPGTYRVLAFKNQQPNLPYRDAEAMRAYESKGQVVHLSAGQKVNVQLQAIRNGE